MSYWGDVDIPELDGGWTRRPYIIVSQDNGYEGGKVRLIAGRDMDAASRVHLTLDQARGLALALAEAARIAETEGADP